MARRRRPMSAATKAKIAKAQKGNKNAYKGGPKAKGAKTKTNTGYRKRRAVLTGVGAAQSAGLALGGLALANPALLAAGGVGLGLAYRSHRKGMAKRAANKKGDVLLKLNRKGGVKTVYKPKAAKGKKVKRGKK